MYSRNYHVLTVVSLFLASAVLLVSCGNSDYQRTEGMVWNTTYHIIYKADTDFSDSIMTELRKVEASVSAFSPTSVVSRINTNQSNLTDSAFREVYNTSLMVWKNSAGAFDPTLAPLINAYGFGYKDAPQPDADQIRDILTYVGIQKSHIQDERLIKPDGRMEFNFSAIAKGYGCDRVAQMFLRNAVTDFMIEIGGEIRMGGKNPDGAKWNISIDKPVFSNDREIHESQMVVPLSNCGMATSGNYRNYKETGGKRIGHTVDPVTGLPATNDMLSATVIIPVGKDCTAPCMLADAYATACMSMGSAKAAQMVLKEGISAMFILSDGSVWRSPSFPK